VQCGPDVSDHFTAWIGLVGVVVGVVVSEGFAARREFVRRKHEDKVRFHDQRLDAYAAYRSAVMALFASAAIWAKTGTLYAGGFADYASDKLEAYTAAFSRALMLIESPVREHLLGVNAHVARMIMDGQTPPDVEEIVEQAGPAVVAFSRAAKDELGIG
jgi:hypothetical protein